MSTIAVKKVKLGDNADTSKNFLIEVPAVADGTLTIKREDGTAVLTVGADGSVQIPGGFETASFIPTVFGTDVAGVATYAFRDGRYIRVGNLLFFEVLLGWSGHTGTGNLGISVAGLPIRAIGTNSVPGSVLTNGFLIGAGQQLAANLNATTKEVDLYKIDPASGVATRVAMDTTVGVLRLAFVCEAA